MRLSQREMDRYRDQLKDLQDAAAEYVGVILAEYRGKYPEASVAECREIALKAIDETLNIFGEQAGARACDFFDEICREENIDAKSEVYEVIDGKKVEDKVRWLAGRIEEGFGREGFEKRITDLTRFYVKLSAFDNMLENCWANNVRYARVPSGIETCAFCFMLSSRGFEYKSEKSAYSRREHGVHDHCDCIIVPGIKGVTEIQGYNPDKMAEKWLSCKETIGGDKALRKEWKNLSAAEKMKYAKKGPADEWKRYQNFCNAKIRAEVEKRDWKWLYSDKEPEIDYNLQPRESFGKFKKEGDYSFSNLDLKPGQKEPSEWRDLYVHDKLKEAGFDLKPLPRKAKGADGKILQGVTTPDLEIDGEIWEIKSPRNGPTPPKKGNELNFIRDQFKESEGNFKNPYDYENKGSKGDMRDQRRVVLNLRYRKTGKSFEEIEKRVVAEMEDQGILEVLLIDENGNIRRYKRG